MTRTRVETDGDERDDDSAAERGDEAADDDYDHLKSLDDGAGCTEIWEHLSENRDD
ncbi:hypothetical protein SAMN04488063_2692 [Halopelagius inordinatus]|uniref:Uncharacterized protein n=1 Tax=Halopelagius inordinatus TaxID=553467 RepID=A0A1I2TPC0_9EURY|nr:hypothetical protein [Halopelagius inordinatus]SFG64161.1 hypothetical protein SAMN04488063_2692 [Halopelagius inordinatus]